MKHSQYKYAHVHSVLDVNRIKSGFRTKTSKEIDFFRTKMDSSSECSYDEEHDDMANIVCEEEESIKDPSFETLTAADIITLMTKCIENVESIVGVSFIVDVFSLQFLFSKNNTKIQHNFFL